MIGTPSRRPAGLHSDGFAQLTRRLVATGLVFFGFLFAGIWQINTAMNEQAVLLGTLRWVVDLNRQTSRIDAAAHELAFQNVADLSGNPKQVSTGHEEFQRSLDTLAQTVSSCRSILRGDQTSFAFSFFEGNLRVLDAIDEFVVRSEKFGQSLSSASSRNLDESITRIRARSGEIVASLATFQNQTYVRVQEISRSISRIWLTYVILLALIFLICVFLVLVPAIRTTQEQKLGYDGAIHLLQERNAAMVLSEENLSAQKRILQSVLNSIGDSVIVFAKNHQLMLQNPAAEALLGSVETGRPFTEWAMGLDLLEFVDGRPRPLGALHLDSPFELEGLVGKVLTLEDDSPPEKTRYFTLSLQTMTDNEGENLGWIVSFHDISNRVENEIVLRQAKRDAETASRSKSEFLANISHEIRTPMTAILGYSDLLLKEDDTSKRRRNHIRIIRRNAQILMKLIDDILDLSKIEAGRFTVEKRRVDIVDLLGDVVSMLQARAIEKNLRLCVRSHSAVPRWVETDPTRLRQILINLVGNAIKFTENGSVMLSVSYDESNAGAPLRFSVVDTGCGIPEDAVARLFSPFAQVDSSATRRHGGAGLGLALSRRLANALGGQLELERSDLTVGSSFVASIDPGDVSTSDWIEKLSEADLGVRAEEDLSHPSVGLSGTRVLLIEDSTENRELLTIYLRSAGADVDSAVDGEDGLHMALQHEYDVVLLDIQLPKMDGYQVLEALKAQNYPTPVVALTAHAMPEERRRGLELGFQDYLVKPVTPDGLVRTVRQFASASRDNTSGPAVDSIALPSEDVDSRKWTRGSDAIRQVIGRFCERLPEEFCTVSRLAEDKKFEDMQKLLHRLRGSAGSCGFTAVMREAESLEDEVRGNPSEESVRHGLRKLEHAIENGIHRYQESMTRTTGQEAT